MASRFELSLPYLHKGCGIMQVAAIMVEVVQGVVCVFDRGMVSPFNDWSDGAYRQGFSWRPGSVSFRTLPDDDVARILVTVFVQTELQVRSDALRAIMVP